MDIERFRQESREAATAWAQQILKQHFVVLDTETTGLGPEHQVIELCVCNRQGLRLLNTLVKPTPGAFITPEAQATHGHTLAALQDAPTMAAMHYLLRGILCESECVVIFNAAFDVEKLNKSLALHGLPGLPAGVRYEDAQVQYSRWIGDWREDKQDFKRQRLVGGNHSAYGDCLALLATLRYMAGQLSQG